MCTNHEACPAQIRGRIEWWCSKSAMNILSVGEVLIDKLVTAGLSIAFETTMHGLVGALIIQLWLTGVKKGEEEFLDSCSDYCTRNIVGRLRLMPFDKEGE